MHQYVVLILSVLLFNLENSQHHLSAPLIYIFNTGALQNFLHYILHRFSLATSDGVEKRKLLFRMIVRYRDSEISILTVTRS